MPLSDVDLDQVVLEWNSRVTRVLRAIDVVSLLRRKNLAMYMALGFTQPGPLADRLVNYYIASSLENTMGDLYELILSLLGPVKVSKEQRQMNGYKGVDFIQITPAEVRLVDLASGSSTKNGGARSKSRRDLSDAAAYWKHYEKNRQQGDSTAVQREVLQVWAVARGSADKSQPDQILRLRGDAMWEYFGAGSNCLARIGEALSRNPITGDEFQVAVDGAVLDLASYLRGKGFLCLDGTVAWSALLAVFP